MENKGPAKGLSGFELKLIAITAMTADHFAWVLFPGYSTQLLAVVLHLAGRIAAPVMWFFVAEGMHYTKDRKRYAERLLMFALLSHFAWCFAFGIPLAPGAAGVLDRTGILWAFAVSAALIPLIESPAFSQPAKYGFIALGCLLALPADWSCIAAMAPMLLYMHRGRFRFQAMDIIVLTATYALVWFICTDRAYGVLQMGAVLALPLIKRYNGTRGGNGRPAEKWLFYVYYPAHLVVIGLLRIAAGGAVGLLY